MVKFISTLVGGWARREAQKQRLTTNGSWFTAYVA